MEKMTLVVFWETGHVLGALTRTADPEGSLEVADVVGDDLPLRSPFNGQEWATIEARRLGVETVDFDESVLLQPHRFAVVDGSAEQQRVLEEPPITPGGQLALSATEIRLTLGVPVSAPVTAWVQIEGGADDVRILQRLSIPGPPAMPEATQPVQLATGNYRALALVPEYGAHFETIILV